MSTVTKDERRQKIESAAFELLAEKGYRRSSMLQIAKRASASNQTLYAWYGNKQGLFRSLIEDGGRAVRELLGQALQHQTDPGKVLPRVGRFLLEFTTGEQAIIMNRAAISDASETGLLGEAIDQVARQEIVARLTSLMAEFVRAGHFRQGTDPNESAESYVSLLFGEVPMRQALGRIAPLTEQEIADRADRAYQLVMRLYGSVD